METFEIGGDLTKKYIATVYYSDKWKLAEYLYLTSYIIAAYIL